LVPSFIIQAQLVDGEIQYTYSSIGYITREEFDEIMYQYNLGGQWMMTREDQKRRDFMRKFIFTLSLFAIALFTFAACNRDNDTPAEGVETTTLRFYYHSIELDPNIYALPEAFLYNAEDVPTESFHQEFIRLMYQHTGLRILSLHFEGSKLYVDLYEDAIAFFNNQAPQAA